MMISNAGKIVNEVYNECSKLYPVKIHDAYLYGSYARGDFDAESDVDILLTLDADYDTIASYRSRLASIVSNISLKHNVTVSVTAKPLAQFRQYSSVMPFYRNVLSEGRNYAV